MLPRIPTVYLSDQALNNLKLYKYASVDHSLVTKYFCRPYWDWAVTLFPMWIAPNLITLIGFGFQIFNLLLVVYFIPDLKAVAPSWVYFSFSIGLWLYSTFDNVDGRQARRTKSSSPLGELFDHGCDALNCGVGAAIQAAAMGLGYSWTAVAISFITTFPFYLSTWEEYHTGILYFGFINGPTEGIILGCIIMAISGVYGPQFWMSPLSLVFNSLGWSLPFPWAATLRVADVLAVVMTSLVFLAHAPFSFYAVYEASQRKNKPLWLVATELIPIIIFNIACYAWLSSPFSTALKSHLLLFIVTVGIVFGRMASKIILAHVTLMPFPYFTWQLIPLVLGAILTNIPVYYKTPAILTPEMEFWYLVGFFVFCFSGYMYWAFVVIEAFCARLGIECLRIKIDKQS